MPRSRTIVSIVLMIAIMFAVIGALAFFKYRQIAGFAGMKWKMPPIAVTSIIVKEDAWQPVLNAVGTVQAVNGVTVSTDLPGIVEKITFESGRQVSQGDALVKLDTKQEEAQLNSAQARMQLGRSN